MSHQKRRVVNFRVVSSTVAILTVETFSLVRIDSVELGLFVAIREMRDAGISKNGTPKARPCDWALLVERLAIGLVYVGQNAS
jgi:hypothetical protein